MLVDYVYCSSCGYEGADEKVTYSRTTADGDWYICPNTKCKEEISNVEEAE